MQLRNGKEDEHTITDEEKRRIVKFDETDNPFSTVHERGGTRSIRWSDPTLPKGTVQATRGSHHTTGIYGATAAGEVMPPVYCFDSGAVNEENFQVKLSWIEGLPKVQGMYGSPTTETYDSHIYVRKSGCNDGQLMQELIENVYLLLFPNCQKETVRDDNGKFIAGPVVFKTDSGQGRLVTTFSSLGTITT